MTETTRPRAGAADQFPLSFTQEFFCALDQGEEGGAFGLRFIIVTGVRITGAVNVAALQQALDDVADRHELLRTVVVRDVDVPYQEVRPPCPVPLEIRGLPPAAGRSRDVRAEELIIEAEQIPMDPTRLPLLRAILGRFDDSDSVLVLSAHHSACDGWSMQIILRDLAAFYASRTTGLPPGLPEIRQYREFAAWQRAGVADPGADRSREYWRRTLADAHVFTLPNDRAKPEIYTRPYSVYNYEIGADVIAKATAMAADTRGSLFMVLLAAFNVLAYQLNGTTAPAIRAFTSGRNDPQFQDTMGLFMNLVPFSTDIEGCTTFLDVVTATRDTCVNAYENEIPINHLEQELPNFNQPQEDPRRSQFILGMYQSQFDEADLLIGERSYEILERELPEPEHPDIPNGLVWNLVILPSGALSGGVLFNLDEFDESTIAQWVSDYQRVLTEAMNGPDREWKAL
jgi:condensation enzyme